MNIVDFLVVANVISYLTSVIMVISADAHVRRMEIVIMVLWICHAHSVLIKIRVVMDAVAPSTAAKHVQKTQTVLMLKAVQDVQRITSVHRKWCRILYLEIVYFLFLDIRIKIVVFKWI